jgi:hypothetical protein
MMTTEEERDDLGECRIILSYSYYTIMYVVLIV